MTLKSILLEELEVRKEFQAHWDTACDNCDEPLFEGDTFYFFGEKRKVCSNCFDIMQQDLEDKL